MIKKQLQCVSYQAVEPHDFRHNRVKESGNNPTDFIQISVPILQEGNEKDILLYLSVCGTILTSEAGINARQVIDLALERYGPHDDDTTTRCCRQR